MFANLRRDLPERQCISQGYSEEQENIYICIYVIYYEELVHSITEVEKSHSLPQAS